MVMMVVFVKQMNEWCDLLEDSKDFSVTTEGDRQVVQDKADAKLATPT